MLKVGLTGGYATGKSFVAAELERCGCLLIYADELGHRVLYCNGEAFEPVVHAFGPGILDAEGSIDRRKLGDIVFGSPELLARLNSFVHPAVYRLEKQMLNAWEAERLNGIAVTEAAILIETGRYNAFDRIILTVCEEETQIARAMKRDHVTREQVLTRMARQMSSEEKKRYADYVIDTSGPKEDTRVEVDRIFRELESLAQEKAT